MSGSLRLYLGFFAGLSLLCADGARAVTARAEGDMTFEVLLPGAEGGRTTEPVIATSGLFFGNELDCAPQCALANLFPDLVLSSATVGTEVSADASTGAGFAGAVASLTNGVGGVVALGSAPGDGPFITYLTWPEPVFRLGGVDLAGLVISRIGFRLDEFASHTPGSDPNHDGVWTDFTFGATLILEGRPSPEPSLFWLGGVALAVASARRLQG
jgi:hypothetical protein